MDFQVKGQCDIEEIEIMPDVTASVVLGQPDFRCCRSNRGGKTPRNNSFNQPWGICVEGDCITVADSGNNRVLIWRGLSFDRPADIVLGQSTFHDCLENRGRDNIKIRGEWLVGSEDWSGERVIARPDACTLAGPRGISVACDKLFVADTNNHRVLIWNSIPAINCKASDIVLGQPDFTSWSANRDGNLCAGSLFFPAGVFSDGVRLFVADKDNHRVLIWKDIPDSNGRNADIVLGQPDFRSRMHNGGRLDKGGPDSLSFPASVFFDGIYLFVADQGNHRILIWDHLPDRNGEPANMVLGQEDFTCRASNRDGMCSACSLRFPSHVYCKDGDLYAVDHGNNRVLVWRGYSWKENEAADLVIGQPDFVTNEHHWRMLKIDDRISNTSTIKIDLADNPNSYTLWGPSTGWVDKEGRVFILDHGNHRVVVWNELSRDYEGWLKKGQ